MAEIDDDCRNKLVKWTKHSGDTGRLVEGSEKSPYHDFLHISASCRPYYALHRLPRDVFRYRVVITVFFHVSSTYRTLDVMSRGRRG